MEKQQLKMAIARAVHSRIPYSFDIKKREVKLRMNDELFDAVVEALDDE